MRGDLADPEDLARALGEGADLLVDCIGYDASDAQRVVTGSADLGSAVVISSAAVYTDAQGAIHGRYARNPREWNVLKHILDGRRHVVLAHGGSSSFQTTAARTIAELVRLAVARPGRRVLNAADPQAPTAAEIVAAVAGDRGTSLAVHTLPGGPQGSLGTNPWAVPHPMVLDMAAAARGLGSQPVTDYAGALTDYLDWLQEVAVGHWRAELTDFPAGDLDLFDYQSEGAWFTSRSRG